MALIFVLFLFPDFIKTETININSDFEINKLDDTSPKESSKISFLKEIPRTKVSLDEKNALDTRNPFLPIVQIDGNLGFKTSEIDLTGIASMNGNYVAFIKTPNGTNLYKEGELIGSEFKLLDIDEKNLTIKISDDTTTHSIPLEKDEK